MHPRFLAASALTASALLFTGCASIVPDPQQVIEDTVEGATGTSIDVGEGASIPEAWPGLPTPDGTLLSSVSADGTTSLSYRLADETPVDALKTALLDAGLEVTAEVDGEIALLAMADSEWTVALSWYTDTDGSILLNYGATPTGG